MDLTITSLYATILTVIMLVLFVRVSKARAKLAVAYGDGGHDILLQRIRCVWSAIPGTF